LVKETWDVILLEGHKLGYSHTTVREIHETDQVLLELTNEYELALQRFNQTVSQRIEAKSVETLAGQVLRFESTLTTGPAEIRIDGRYADGQMHITTTTSGKTIPSTLDWDPTYGGFFAELQTLERQPLRPGETRRLKALLAGTAQVGEVELTAAGVESVELLDGSRDLLRIESVTRLGDTAIKSVLWTDERGEPLKTVSLLGIQPESYRTTQAVAREASPAQPFDLGQRTIVKVARPLPSPHSTKRVVYRARLAEGDPSKRFANSSTQHVKRLDEHTAEITVQALRPGEAVNSEFVAPIPPTDADRQPNNLIQSDDPAVIALATSIAPGESDPWKLAQAFEKYVQEFVTTTRLSQAIASAADVVQSREGDCTEHAVLLAALCRARGLPARAAIGLVYYGPQQGFAYHMWNEVWIDGQWIPLDSTLGLGGIGAAHLKVADSNLAAASPITDLLPVIEVIGQLELELVAVDQR